MLLVSGILGYRLQHTQTLSCCVFEDTRAISFAAGSWRLMRLHLSKVRNELSLWRPLRAVLSMITAMGDALIVVAFVRWLLS